MAQVGKRSFVAVVLAAVLGSGVLTAPSAHAWGGPSNPPRFSVTASRTAIKVAWNPVLSATKYQVKIRKTSQKKSAGYVFTVPQSRLRLNLKKSHLPALKGRGAYVFKVCAVNAFARKCSSVGMKPGTSGAGVSTTRPDRAASKANSCFAKGLNAFVKEVSGGMIALLVPGIGEMTAGGVVALSAIREGIEYIDCSGKNAWDPVIDDYAYITSVTGGFGGHGGGGGGGGSWRSARAAEGAIT